MPDVPGEVFTSAKDHPALAVASALEGLCGSGAVALCDAGVPRGRVRGLRGLGGDGDGDGSHVVRGVERGVVWMKGVVHARF